MLNIIKDLGEMFVLFFYAPLIALGIFLAWMFWTEWMWLLF